MELVPLRQEFAAQMLAGGPNDAEVRKLTGTHQSFELKDYEAYIERTLNDPNRCTRAITEDGRFLGEVVLTINPDNRSAGIVYQKLGFREGEFYDAIVMSILSTDNI